MYRILIVEDDQAITGVLCRQLEKWGYLPKAVTDFNHVIEDFQAHQPHLVLMDLSLPFFNGYYWCREIRKCSQTPILVISSAGDDMNLVMALNMGADDFVAKPFHLDVVTAKIQALLRRTYDFGGDTNLLEHQGVTLHLGNASLCYQEDSIGLTRNELRILQLLLERKGNIVSRNQLMQRLWETENFIDDNTLTVNVTRLRKKLEELGLENFIVTKKGLGYLVEA